MCANIFSWAKISPPLFDFLTQLDYLKSSQDLYCIEAKAFLYMMLKEFDKALLSYLDLEITTLQISKSNNDNTKRDLRHIFDLIEKQVSTVVIYTVLYVMSFKNLFGVIKDRILHLVRLSPELSETLLMRNIDKLPVYAVVEQLKDDRALLHWYLHGLFVNIPEVYNTQEYAEFHVQQVPRNYIIALLCITDTFVCVFCSSSSVSDHRSRPPRQRYHVSNSLS